MPLIFLCHIFMQRKDRKALTYNVYSVTLRKLDNSFSLSQFFQVILNRVHCTVYIYDKDWPSQETRTVKFTVHGEIKQKITFESGSFSYYLEFCNISVQEVQFWFSLMSICLFLLKCLTVSHTVHRKAFQAPSPVLNPKSALK